MRRRHKRQWSYGRRENISLIPPGEDWPMQLSVQGYLQQGKRLDTNEVVSLKLYDGGHNHV